MELLQDSNLSSETIGPHWASLFPEHLSPDWDKDQQRRVVWHRLRELRTLASRKPSKQTERYHALRQEYQKTQVESSHNLLYRDTEGMANHTTYRKQLYSLKELYQSGDSGDKRGQAKGLIKTACADKCGPYEDICDHIGATIA